MGQKGAVIRYAGDEFVIVLNEDNEKNAENCRNSIKDNLNAFNNLHEKKYKLSASIGYGVFDMAECNVDQVLKEIDKRMYEDKKTYYAIDYHNRRCKC